jgi:hypothetical protein
MFLSKLFINHVQCQCKADLYKKITVQNTMTRAMKKVFYCAECNLCYSKNGNRLDMDYFRFVS